MLMRRVICAAFALACAALPFGAWGTATEGPLEKAPFRLRSCADLLSDQPFRPVVLKLLVDAIQDYSHQPTKTLGYYFGDDGAQALKEDILGAIHGEVELWGALSLFEQRGDALDQYLEALSVHSHLKKVGAKQISAQLLETQWAEKIAEISFESEGRFIGDLDLNTYTQQLLDRPWILEAERSRIFGLLHAHTGLVQPEEFTSHIQAALALWKLPREQRRQIANEVARALTQRQRNWAADQRTAGVPPPRHTLIVNRNYPLLVNAYRGLIEALATNPMPEVETIPSREEFLIAVSLFAVGPERIEGAARIINSRDPESIKTYCDLINAYGFETRMSIAEAELNDRIAHLMVEDPDDELSREIAKRTRLGLSVDSNVTRADAVRRAVRDAVNATCSEPAEQERLSQMILEVIQEQLGLKGLEDFHTPTFIPPIQRLLEATQGFKSFPLRLSRIRNILRLVGAFPEEVRAAANLLEEGGEPWKSYSRLLSIHADALRATGSFKEANRAVNDSIASKFMGQSYDEINNDQSKRKVFFQYRKLILSGRIYYK